MLKISGHSLIILFSKTVQIIHEKVLTDKFLSPGSGLAMPGLCYNKNWYKMQVLKYILNGKVTVEKGFKANIKRF